MQFISFNPQKGTKSELEIARTFGTIFSNINFRQELLEAHSEESFRDILGRCSHTLAEIHSRKDVKLAVTEDDGPVSLLLDFVFLPMSMVICRFLGS